MEQGGAEEVSREEDEAHREVDVGERLGEGGEGSTAAEEAAASAVGEGRAVDSQEAVAASAPVVGGEGLEEVAD